MAVNGTCFAPSLVILSVRADMFDVCIPIFEHPCQPKLKAVIFQHQNLGEVGVQFESN